MIQEEILYKKSRTGTTAFFFVSNLDQGLIPEFTNLSYVTLNNFGQPTGHGYFDAGPIFKIIESKNYYSNFELSGLSNNYLTGYSYSQIFNNKLTEEQKASVESRFFDSTSSALQNLDNSVNATPYIIFQDKEIDDMFVNIKLSRTYSTLDTLKIYNKTINSIDTQEAKTGVLFGKLEAIQLIKDENGNAHRIPLRNVPIGIFTSSDEFPTPTSLDDDGDRFFLNLKENSEQNKYFDEFAYQQDQGFLRTASQFSSTPDKFKHITLTNDNGEFIIFDCPIGNQTLVFEVDLFKQGLTWDEVALNFFPFPTTNDVNIGQYPCYYYNQIPVDVVSTWGLEQSGYTEINASVNLDLRKWTTYIFPPAAYGPEKLEETTSKNAINSFKILIRDMASKAFSSSTITVTQVPDDLDRKTYSKYTWANEMTDQRNQLEFVKFGCHVFKLPANLYDPSAYRTNDEGIPQTGNTSQKGVWLSAYQFRTYVNQVLAYCDSGGQLIDNKFYSHYAINYNNPTGPENPDDDALLQLGQGIYSQPWSINFPEPYAIPKKPTLQRYSAGSQRSLQNPYIIEEPAYLDGDLVGNVVNPNFDFTNSGGYSLQYPTAIGNWHPNHISYVATRSYMYKYENGVAPNETYSSGYEPTWSQQNLGPYSGSQYQFMAGLSHVINGEKYQRLECGFGYFMKYREWPRIFRIDYTPDLYFFPDVLHKDQLGLTNTGLDGDINNPGPGTSAAQDYNGYTSLKSWYNNVYNLQNQNLAFAFNNNRSGLSRKNTIDIYRIVNSGPNNINKPINFVISTSMRVDFGQCERVFSFQLTNTGSIAATFTNSFADHIWVKGPGITGQYVAQNDSFTLPPGCYIILDDLTVGGHNSNVSAAMSYVLLTLPGNSDFDLDTNKYTQCKYDVRLLVTAPHSVYANNMGHFDDAGTSDCGNLYFPSALNPATYEFRSILFENNDDDLKGIRGESSNSHIWQIYIHQQ